MGDKLSVMGPMTASGAGVRGGGVEGSAGTAVVGSTSCDMSGPGLPLQLLSLYRSYRCCGDRGSSNYGGSGGKGC